MAELAGKEDPVWLDSSPIYQISTCDNSLVFKAIFVIFEHNIGLIQAHISCKNYKDVFNISVEKMEKLN